MVCFWRIELCSAIQQNSPPPITFGIKESWEARYKHLQKPNCQQLLNCQILECTVVQCLVLINITPYFPSSGNAKTDLKRQPGASKGGDDNCDQFHHLWISFSFTNCIKFLKLEIHFTNRKISFKFLKLQIHFINWQQGFSFTGKNTCKPQNYVYTLIQRKVLITLQSRYKRYLHI